MAAVGQPLLPANIPPVDSAVADRNSTVTRQLGVRTKSLNGTTIFAEGDDARLGYMVVSGTVRVCRLLSDGRRHISAFCFAGDSFGFDSAERRPASAEAATDCELIALRHQTIFGLADRDAVVARQLLERANADLADARDHLLLLGCQTAVERVVSFLLEMAERAGDGKQMTLPMTRQDMADYLGLRIETVSRTLTRLERRGALEMTDARHIRLLQPSAMRRLAA